MIYRVSHRSQIAYGSPVADARFNLRLRPAAWPGQTLHSHSLAVDPIPMEDQAGSGPYPVETDALMFGEPLREIRITSEFTMDVEPVPLPAETPGVDAVRGEALRTAEIGAWAPAPYLFASRIVSIDMEIADWAAGIVDRGAPVLQTAQALASAIHREFVYEPGTTTSATSPAEAFRAGRGVCQDFAHVMIAGLRGLGLPAAYVSGYLRTLPPPGQERLVGADAMHAWVAVWCGADAGWIGVDPTNDCLARESHIVIGMGRDYADVAPIDGVFVGAAPQNMRVAVDVLPQDQVSQPQLQP